MKTTNLDCLATINTLGIANDLDLLCNDVGLHHFVFRMYQPTACWPSNFWAHWSTPLGSIPHAQVGIGLNSASWTTTLISLSTSGASLFVFVNNDGHIRVSAYMLDPYPLTYFLAKATFLHSNMTAKDRQTHQALWCAGIYGLPVFWRNNFFY